MIEVYTDGSTRPVNPGHSGFGAVLYREGDEVASDSGYLGDDVTNNEAEYCALIAGLMLAKTLQSQTIEDITVYSDSLTVLNQVSGEWAQNSKNLRCLWEEVNRQLNFIKGAGDVTVTLQHVRGHQGIVGNEEADRLAGLAADSHAAIDPWFAGLIRDAHANAVRSQGFEELASTILSWLRGQGIKAIDNPRIADKFGRRMLREVNDIGAQTLLYAPEIVAVLPYTGTTLIAIATRFVPVNGGRALHVMPAEEWSALHRWQGQGANVLVVHKPYGAHHWMTNRELRWGTDNKEATATCSLLSDISGEDLGTRCPTGWTPTVNLTADWLPFVTTIRALQS